MATEKPYLGRTVVITGASSGFGKGVARRLAKGGANVALAARRTHLIEELAAECGSNAIAVTADVSREADVEKLMRAAKEAFGRIDVWINNAAVGAIGPYTEIPRADIGRMLEINLHSVIYGSYFALREFKGQGFGTLINLSSVAAKVAFPYYTPYSASKYAITGLSASLHEELILEGYDNIHVCTVHPWATDTPWFEHTANYTGHAAEMKPMDDPEIVINAIVDLLDRPQESVNVGTKTKGTTASSHLTPDLTERSTAKQIKTVIQNAPPARNTTGSLHAPLMSGIEVEGGVRERMKAEERGG